MAREVALSTIAENARILADMQNSAFASDTKCLALLNLIYPRLYDELVMSSENYYADSESFSITSAATAYALPTDFYKILGVDFSTGGTTYLTLFPYPEGERNSSYISSNIPSGTIRLRYVPAPVVFTSMADTLDGVAGWDRMLSLLLAIDLLDAEESNSDRLYRKYQEELQRIRSTADRDLGMPATVSDVTRDIYSPQFSWLKYRLYGNNIEFIG